jgi:hypothetical protein
MILAYITTPEALQQMIKQEPSVVSDEGILTYIAFTELLVILVCDFKWLFNCPTVSHFVENMEALSNNKKVYILVRDIDLMSVSALAAKMEALGYATNLQPIIIKSNVDPSIQTFFYPTTLCFVASKNMVCKNFSNLFILLRIQTLFVMWFKNI